MLEWGAADHELTFVLVHGFTDLAYGWRGVAERLAPHARVIAPDLRGHGDSDRIGAGGYYHFLDYVADLDDVIAQLVPGRFVLVGHSMGGTVSTYWAGTRPERPAALALLEGLGPPDLAGTDGPARTAQWIAAWKNAAAHPHKVLPSIEAAAARLRAKDRLLDEVLASELAEHGTRPVDGGVVWKHDPLHRTMGPYPYRLETAIKYWTRITCPVLVVDGADSKLNLPDAERAARRAHFADHHHVVLERCGHEIPRHQPARLAELLLDLGLGRPTPARPAR